MLDLKKLRYFVVVAETLNVAQAAAQLHISQSPLSRQMIGLEQQLGLALFTREKKRLQLTAAGREFLNEARALLGHALQLENKVREEATGKAGTLTIGFVEGAIHTGALQAALQRFRLAVPDARVELRNLRSTQQMEEVRHGHLDVGFTYATPARKAEMNGTQVAEDDFMITMPRRHHLARGPLQLKRLDGEAFVALPERLSPEARQTLLDACAKFGFSPNICFEAADPSVALGLVEAGIGLAIVQSSLRRGAGPGVVFRSLPPGFPLSVRVFCISRKHCRPLASRFLAAQAEPAGA